MEDKNNFEVIIIGGSYAGLSAAMCLGRFLRKVLVIDSGAPCNIRAPRSHNFLTQDGKKPAEISAIAREQVERYTTVRFRNDAAIDARKTADGFDITTHSGALFKGKKLIFASGVKDIMPDIPGLSECWGLSVVHCPYCHGYESHGKVAAILANGEVAYQMATLICNLNKQLTILTSGSSTLDPDQLDNLKKHNIKLTETKVSAIVHNNGQLKEITFADATRQPFDILYTALAFVQHNKLPSQLGCSLLSNGLIEIDRSQCTSVRGVYACGDSCSMMRTIAKAVASGNFAGAMVNKELAEEFINSSV